MTKKIEADATRERVPDYGRLTAAAAATERYRGRSYYVDRRDGKGETIGTQRSLVASLVESDGALPLAASGIGPDLEIELPAVVYDGNPSDVGTPLRVVLTGEEATRLADRLAAYVTALGGTK